MGDAKRHRPRTKQLETINYNGRALQTGTDCSNQHPADKNRPPAKSHHQQRCRQGCQHHRHKLQRQPQRRQPGDRRQHNTDKGGIDDIDIHRGHRQRLCDGQPRHITFVRALLHIFVPNYPAKSAAHSPEAAAFDAVASRSFMLQTPPPKPLSDFDSVRRSAARYFSLRPNNSSRWSTSS